MRTRTLIMQLCGELIIIGIGSVIQVIGLWFGFILIAIGIIGLLWSASFNRERSKKLQLELARLMERYDLVKGEIEYHISKGDNSFYAEDDDNSLKELSKHRIVMLEQRRTITPSFPLDYGYWKLTDKGNKMALKLKKYKA